eukprot:1289807-Pleurochrysis_carterae.AAC.2
MFGSPIIWSRSRTGGGPPSGASPVKNRLTENVEHGGEAIQSQRMIRLSNVPVGARTLSPKEGRVAHPPRDPDGCLSSRPPIRLV